MIRAVVPVAAVAFVIVLAAGAAVAELGPQLRRAFLDLVALYVGLGAGFVGALRLGRPAAAGAGSALRGLRAAAAVVVGIALSVGVACAIASALWLSMPTDNAVAARSLGALASGAILGGLASFISVGLGRAGVLLWTRWDRLRRRRLLWALTHAQLLAALALAVTVAAVLTMRDLGSDPLLPPGFAARFEDQRLGSTPMSFVLFSTIVFRVVPAAGALLIMSLLVAVAVLPAAAAISYVVVRRATSRLEQLAEAVGAIGRGELSARVPVGGEDEIAALQRGVNAMAAELQRTLKELESERDRVAGLLEARRQLVASVSHELRTPIATARGYLDAALDRASDPSSEDLATVQSELTRLERLVDDLFALSQAEVGRLALRIERVDVGALVRHQVEIAAPLAWRQRKVEVLAEVPPELPPANADAQRLDQVVSNLIANATRHTPPGGLVVVAVAAEPDAVRIEVRDTGEGIAPDDLPHVFERFYRGKSAEPGAGAGLGLALVKELTEAMGGSVEATSVPGEGSCFTVRLRQNRDI